ncbi:MAG: septal ring lytic transglycosylase RlpA family protein [Rhodoplanes sp.]
MTKITSPPPSDPAVGSPSGLRALDCVDTPVHRGRPEVSNSEQFPPLHRRNFNMGRAIARRPMITKAYVLAVAMVLVALAVPRSAADTESDECGLASVYSSVSEQTASGEDTLPADFTAAHRSLPFGTLVTIDNRENGRSAMVRITDRGPFVDGRIIDVSHITARHLGFSGLTQVCLNILPIAESSQ